MPDLDSLRCFVAAATHPSFKAAAKQVSLSPGAFSDRIKGLEATVGAQLFIRSTRSISLTSAGLALLPQARVTLDAAATCLEVVGGGIPPFKLSLGTRFVLGLSWLLPSLDSLSEERPERSIDLIFGDTTDLIEALRQGRADAVVGSMRLNMPRLRYALLHEEQYCLVANPELLARTPLSEPAHAAHHTVIDGAADLPLLRYWTDALPPEQRWSFGNTSVMGTIAAIRQRVLSQHGVGVLPLYFVQPDLDSGALVQVAPQVQASSDWFRLIWREGHPQEAELLAVAEHLRGLPLR
jgi:DNA-binding transcriptional LysR family regulator